MTRNSPRYGRFIRFDSRACRPSAQEVLEFGLDHLSRFVPDVCRRGKCLLFVVEGVDNGGLHLAEL